MADEKQSVFEQFWRSLTFRRVVAIIGLFLFALLVIGIWQNDYKDAIKEIKDWLGQAGQVNFARGLITTFVVLTTLLIALTLVASLFFGNAKDREDRFSMGKEVLTIFIGILGTIMGFYYAENTVSSDKYAKLTESVLKEAGQTSAIDDLEKKGFVALLGKDFDSASQAFADAYKMNPTYNNINEINTLFKNNKDAFATASVAKDAAAKEGIWQIVFCDISNNKRTKGMSSEMISQVQKNCTSSNANTPTPTPTPT